MAEVKAELGGRTLTIVPLKLKTAREALPRLAAWQGNLFDPAQIDAVSDFIFLALRQANPDLTKEFIEEHLDVTAVDELIGRIGQAMGLERKAGAPGEAASP